MKEKDVKVVDKRSFTKDGELKEPLKTSSTSPERSKEPSKPKLPPKLDFESLVLSLYTSCLMSLGKIGDEKTKGKRDFGSAKQSIDILELLEEKTKGNLTEREQKVLQGILTELRLTFAKEWEKASS